MQQSHLAATLFLGAAGTPEGAAAGGRRTLRPWT